MSAKRKSFSIERLESREMKAGDVAASLVNGELYLTEAAGQAGLDNSVMVSQLANGKIRVSGNGTNDGSMSHINGLDFQDFNVTGGLHINFGAGNDLAVIGGDPAFGGTAANFSTVDINMGAPPLVATQAKTAAFAGPTTPYNAPDRDNVIIWGMNTRGKTNISTGADEDWVFIANSRLGDQVGADDVTINTGAGKDTAQLKNLQGITNGKFDIQLYSNINEADDDVAWLDNAYAYGNINIRAGAGNDTVHMYNSTAYQDINIDTGLGNDTGDVSGDCAVQNFFANMGDGNDTLTVNNLYTIHGKTTLDGGAGSDHLNKSGVTPSAQLTQINWEYLNGRIILGPVVLDKAKNVSLARA